MPGSIRARTAGAAEFYAGKLAQEENSAYNKTVMQCGRMRYSEKMEKNQNLLLIDEDGDFRTLPADGGRPGRPEQKPKQPREKGGFEMRRAFRIIGSVLLCVVLLAVLCVGILTLAEYRPRAVEEITVTGRASDRIGTGESVRLLIWNTGYSALGDNADFFMDGGTSVYTADRDRTEENLAGIVEGIREEAPDLIMLQETDKHSARSHYINQIERYRAGFPGMQSAFACNFRALFVPYPLPPIGTVESGILTLSSYRISGAERISLPCPFSWPVKTVNLKRCLLVTRLPVEGSDRELVLVNLHLEAYDDGTGKREQTKVLADLLQEEAAKGNYVIAGGDFNQSFSNADLSAWPHLGGEWQPGVLEVSELGAGLTALMDPAAPTCRSLRTAYAGKREGFQFYMIDGFIVSDGVTVEEVRTVDRDFRNSDHNPVVLTFKLN